MTNEEIVKRALEILEEQIAYRVDLPFMGSPDAAKDYAKLRLATQKREVFACLWLDNRHRVLKWDELFYGTIDGSAVYPRDIVRAALDHNAAAVIFVHNHPSGSSEPSSADERITQKLKDALALIDVRTLDHLIIGNEVYSFAEHGML